MTGTYAGQFVMQGFLQLKISPWKRVLLTRSVAILPAVVVAAVTKNASTSLSNLGEWLNVLQSIQLPFALIPVLICTSDPRIMGKFKNTFALQIVVWLIAAFVIVRIARRGGAWADADARLTDLPGASFSHTLPHVRASTST